jgi:hypothetical protein
MNMPAALALALIGLIACVAAIEVFARRDLQEG